MTMAVDNDDGYDDGENTLCKRPSITPKQKRHQNMTYLQITLKNLKTPNLKTQKLTLLLGWICILTIMNTRICNAKTA